jgi:hypothetical protein
MKIAKNQEKSKKQNKNANTSWYCKKKAKKVETGSTLIGFREALRNTNLVENGFSVSTLK